MPYVSAFVRRLCPREADDLAQETMARALRAWDTYEPGRPLRSWLLKIAFRVFLDHRRRAARAPTPIGEDVERVADRARDAVEAADLLDAIARRLRPIEFEVLLRFHQRGESVEEISVATGLPAGTVKSHLHRARRRVARINGDPT